MKQTTQSFFAAAIFTLLGLVCSFAAQAQSWIYVGEPAFNYDYCYYPSIAIDSAGVPFVVCADDGASPSGHASVMRYDGSYWQYVGNRGFSNFSINYNNLIFDHLGNLFLSIEEGDTTVGISVLKYSDTGWAYIGMPQFATHIGPYHSLAVDNNGTPFVAFSNGDLAGGHITVMKFNSGSWETVGAPDISGGIAYRISIAIGKDNIPFVSYIDSTHGNKLTVMMYDSLGWHSAGPLYLSPGQVYFPSISIDTGGVPYVAFADSVSQSVRLIKYVSDTGWADLEPPCLHDPYTNSMIEGNWTLCAIDRHNTPFVFYVDSIGILVKKMTDTGWVMLGSHEFEPLGGYNNKLAVSKDGTPYVSSHFAVLYYPYAGISVMKYNTALGVAMDDAPQMRLYPDPTNGRCFIELPQTRTQCHIEVYDLVGRCIVTTDTEPGTSGYTLDLTGHPAGEYIVRMVYRDQVIVNKVVKM